MNAKKSIFQSLISLVLLVAMLFQVVSISGALTDYDEFKIKGYTYNSAYGHEYTKFNNGFYHNYHSAFNFRTATDSSGNKLEDSVYCIQPGKAINTSKMVVDKDKTYLEKIKNIETTAAQKANLLRFVFTFGENESYISAKAKGEDALKAWLPRYVATQMLLWEVVTEDRDENFDLLEHTYYVADIADDFSQAEKDAYKPYYDDYVSKIKAALKTPKLNMSEIKMEYKDGMYSAVLTDENSALDNYNVTSQNPLISVSVSGNKITLTSELPIRSASSLRLARKNNILDVKIYKGSGNVSTQAFAKGIPASAPPEGEDLVLGIEETQTGVIEIQKVSTNPELSNNENYSLAGAQFEISANGFETITLTTDANGFATTGNTLPFGEYTVKEVVAPKGYLLNDSVYKLVVNHETPVKNALFTASQNVNETPKGGFIKIYKHDAETGAVPQGGAQLNGAIFDILDANGNVVDTIDCGNETFGISKLLPIGSYSIVEKEAPIGYIKDEKPISVAITEKNTETYQEEVTINNPVIKGNVVITKLKTAKNPDGTLADVSPFAGVTFTLKSKTSGAIYQSNVKTDENGRIVISDLPYDTYEIIEDVPTGFEANGNKEIVVSENNKTYEIDITNIVASSTLSIQKETKDNINIANIPFQISGITLAGTTFTTTASTDENGLIQIEVPNGNYSITELDCEANKYYSIPEIPDVSIMKDETVKVFNKAIAGDVSVEKYLQNIHLEYDLGEGISFNLKGKSYAGYGIDLTKTTDANGSIVFTDIPVGNYILTEVEDTVSEKYIISEPVEITVATSGMTGIKVMNDIKTSTINITKSQLGNNEIKVPNAEYSLYLENGEIYKVGITDENGVIVMDNIPYGKYILRETAAPEGYALNETEYSIDIHNHAEVINIETEDELILTDIYVVKRSRETGEVLANTEFTIYHAETNEAIASATTDVMGVAIFESIPYGNYVVKETRPPEGYANDSEPIDIVLDSNYATAEPLEFRNSPLPQTGFQLTNSILLLVLTFLLFLLSIACNEAWTLRKKVR